MVKMQDDKKRNGVWAPGQEHSKNILESVGGRVIFKVSDEERVVGAVLERESPLCCQSVLSKSLVPRITLLHAGSSWVTVEKSLESNARIKPPHILGCDNERSDLLNCLSLLVGCNFAAMLGTLNPGHHALRANTAHCRAA